MLADRFPCRFGKYILLKALNTGGMAELYCAKFMGAEHFERLVAVKCMLPQFIHDPSFVNMFIDEAKLAAQLSHANIVQIIDLGRLQEQLYIVMEMVHGRDVRHILRTAKLRNYSIEVGFAAYSIARAAEGLNYAHQKKAINGMPLQLVHRDISPQNLLIAYDGEIKVVDFGIAKANNRATETQAGVLKGKFAYMSPEQVTGRAFDHRSDIFALGAVLFEMLTQQRLFVGDNDLAVLEAVREARLPNLAQVLPASAHNMIPILEGALAKDPSNRYGQAAYMADDLQKVANQNGYGMGSRSALTFMHSLYAQEIHAMQIQLQQFAKVQASDCVVTLASNQEAVPLQLSSTPAGLETKTKTQKSSIAAVAAGQSGQRKLFRRTKLKLSTAANSSPSSQTPSTQRLNQKLQVNSQDEKPLIKTAARWWWAMCGILAITALLTTAILWQLVRQLSLEQRLTITQYPRQVLWPQILQTRYRLMRTLSSWGVPLEMNAEQEAAKSLEPPATTAQDGNQSP